MPAAYYERLGLLRFCVQRNLLPRYGGRRLHRNAERERHGGCYPAKYAAAVVRFCYNAPVFHQERVVILAPAHFCRRKARAELNALGGLNTKEIRTLVVFLTMVTLWLGGSNLEPYIGFKAPEGFVALLGFVLLFVPGLRVFDDWKVAAKSIDWGGLVLIAGGISAGMMLASTGAARWLAWGMLSGVGELHPVLRVLAVIGMVELLKIFFSSNSVTGAVVMPLIIALAMDIGMNPWILAGPAGIATSMAFIMVTSSPTNVIPYSSGYFRISEFAKSGVVMTIIGILAVTASVAIFGRFANMNIW